MSRKPDIHRVLSRYADLNPPDKGRTAALPDPPPRIVAKVFDLTAPILSKQVLAERVPKWSSGDVARAKRLAPQARPFDGRLDARGPLDLRDWEPMGRVVDPPREFKLEIRGNGIGSSWEGDTMTMAILVNPWVHKSFRSLHRTITHEATHLGQTLLNTWGLPPEEVRSLGVYQSLTPFALGGQDKTYALDDREFYTRIRDNVVHFKHWARSNRHLDASLLGLARDVWVGEANLSDPTTKKALKGTLRHRDFDSFFYHLRNNAPSKWREAVREFYAATGRVVRSR